MVIIGQPAFVQLVQIVIIWDVDCQRHGLYRDGLPRVKGSFVNKKPPERGGIKRRWVRNERSDGKAAVPVALDHAAQIVPAFRGFIEKPGALEMAQAENRLDGAPG